MRNLDAERKGIREFLKHLELSEALEIIEKVGVSLTEIFDVFQDARYQNRIVGFHYGGHADGFRLLLNDQNGNQNIDGNGIVSLLAQQQSLKFAFFNACSTKEYAEKLKNTLPLVISTDSDILDEAAKDLAIRFYKALSENMIIQRAFLQAQAFLTSQYGRDTQNLYAQKRNISALSLF